MTGTATEPRLAVWVGNLGAYNADRVTLEEEES